jgi:hypothetical protein
MQALSKNCFTLKKKADKKNNRYQTIFNLPFYFLHVKLKDKLFVC